MRKLWHFLLIAPILSWGAPQNWEAKSEEEALFLRRIADFWQEGEYQIAKNQIEEFLSQYPNSPFAAPLYAAFGDLLLREKNYSAALSYYSKITQEDLSNQIFLNRMQCLYQLEWYATLADECETFLKKEDLTSEQKLQTVYYLAISLYQQCLNASKESENLVNLATRALPHFEMLSQTELSNEIAAAFAHLACILQDYSKASSIYLDLAKQMPETEEDMLFQAALIQAEYDQALACETFEKIAEKGKNKAKEAKYNSLVLDFDAGNYEKILRQKDGLLQQIPTDKQSMAHLFLGRSFLAKKQYNAAIEEFKNYLCNASTGETLRGALISLIDSSFRADDLASLDLALAKLTSLFPGDSEVLKGKFSRALVLKKGQQIPEAKKELEELLAMNPHFSEAPQAAFELAHLDYQAKAWYACREKARNFITKFPEHALAPYAWRYLISASVELSSQSPQSKELKEQLAFDLESLLRQKKILSSEERCDWEFLLAKTNFELGCYEEALDILVPLIKVPFSQQANAYLLAALCYKDGLGDLKNFYSFAEQALQKHADLIPIGMIHVAMFNACIDIAKQEESWLEKGAEHLFAALETGATVQKENMLWLADHFYNQIEKKNELGLKISNDFIDKTCSLFKKVAELCGESNEDFLSLEEISYKLAKINQISARPSQAIEIIRNFNKQKEHFPELAWKHEKDSLLLLGQALTSNGQLEQALDTFDHLIQDKASLRTTLGAMAALESARLKWVLSQKNTSLSSESVFPILSQLKDLVLQKNLPNEPLHLEAALDYIDFQTQLDPDPEKKRLSLLLKTKEDFETTSDILSKDYHEARVRSPQKNLVFQGYMQFVEAEILYLQSQHQEINIQKELQAKAKDILLQIVEGKIHPALVARALKRLKDVPDFEQET